MTEIKNIGILLIGLILLVTGCAKDENLNPLEPEVPSSSRLILFDKGHGELAGNADWTIGSSPDYIGGYSDFGEALRNDGYKTESINSITTSSLNGAKVLVLAEPNTPLETSSINAILSFVNAGGGLFLIGNHDGADRNNNGWDAGDVLNEFSPNNFGIYFVADAFTDTLWNIESTASDITVNINSVGCYLGCTLTISGNARGHVWKAGVDQSSTSSVYVATSTYGKGKIVAIGDSAIFDDGTGAPGENLHNNWDNIDNATLALNIIKWLAE